MNIQWFPGHMAKSKKLLSESISLVDVVIELLDARIPISSRNPLLDKLSKDKKKLIVLNKADMADPAATQKWVEYFKKHNAVIQVNSTISSKKDEIEAMAKDLMKEKIESQIKRGRQFVPVRAMIVGIPNVGKSTFINKLIGVKGAKTGNKPGVTRGKQWLKINKDFELLDTPGILWPKFEDEKVGIHLAITGAINDDILDKETLAIEFIQLIQSINPTALTSRYNITPTEEDTPITLLTQISISRGFKLKGGSPDLLRTSTTIIDEFRNQKLGRITLEYPTDILT